MSSELPPGNLRAVAIAGLLLLGGCRALDPSAASANGGRRHLSLDASWAFRPGDIPGAQAPGFDDRGWRRLDLPHDWSIESAPDHSAPGGGQVGFFPSGIGWYRRTLAMPAGWAGRTVEVEFEGAYMNAEVWINGHPLGRHPYGYTPFRYNLTPWLQTGDGNVLAVRIDNSAEPNSRWYSGSGIYRHVWLDVTGPVRIAPGGVFLSTRSLSADSADVHAEVTVQNRPASAETAALEISLLDPEGRMAGHARVPASLPAGGDLTLTAEIPVPHPRAWSPDSPVLYRADIRLISEVGRVVPNPPGKPQGQTEPTAGWGQPALPSEAGQTLDNLSVLFGIRTIAVSAERGFELNGQTLKLTGGSVHHDNGVLGAAAFDRAEERRVELLKAAGFNAVRTAHNPPSPAFLDACDRLGLLVMDEAFDCWEKPKNPHDYSVYFKDWWQQDVDAWIARDRDHPSVVFWSIGNEVFERGNADGARIAAMLAARIRQLDPSRPLTAGINGLGPKGDWTRLDPLFASLDVAGYNYEIARAEADHARLPGRVIVTTESYATAGFQNWAAVQDHAYVIGEFVWSAMDYLGEAGIGRVFPPGQSVLAHWQGDMWPWHGAECGDIDLTGWRRPDSHYRNILWNRGERLYAAVMEPAPGGGAWGMSRWAETPALPSWTWPGHEGKTLSVEVPSRYDSVRLYLNGRLLGEKPTGRAQEFKAEFTVPYAPGLLRATGVQGGREMESFELRTAGPAARIRLTPDRTSLTAGGQDLSFVTVEILDRDGVWVPDAAPEVRFSLEGPGEIAGLGTADMTSLESYRANPHRLFQGRGLVVIRTGREPGPIRLTAEAPGLPPVSLSLSSSR